MSRSYKKSTCKLAGDSNKKYKTIANKKFRKGSKLRLKNGLDPFFNLNEVYDTYLFPSDGLAYYVSKRDIERISELIDDNRYYRKIIGK